MYFVLFFVCVGMGVGGIELDENEERSGINEPLKFHLPFPYKIYVGEYGLKIERESLLFVFTLSFI